MPTLDYKYVPQFGVEDYDDSNGGAKVTNDNLLISLWGAEDPIVPSAISDIIVPQYADDGTPEAQRQAYRQSAKSRDSAKFYVDLSTSKTLPAALLAVLNPPQEFRQKLVKAATYNGGDPSLLASYTVNTSLQVCFDWLANGYLAIAQQNAFIDDAPAPLSCYVSQLVPLSVAGGAASPQAPFLKTNGANGVAPEFFGTDAAGTQEMFAAIESGDFYVAMMLSGLIVSSYGYIEIRWPHSGARA